MLNLIFIPQTHNLSVSCWMDFVFLYTDNSCYKFIFNDVICIHFSVSFYSIPFTANLVQKMKMEDNGQEKRYKSEKKVRNRVYKHKSLRRKKRRYSWEENDQGYDADMKQVMTKIPQHLQ